MPIVVVSSKGQVTIPKQVRKALNLRPSEKVIVEVEGDHAIIKPLRGSLLDLGGSVKSPENEKPVDFRRVREEVKKRVAKRIARKG
jgi:antitoxin PrlF